MFISAILLMLNTYRDYCCMVTIITTKLMMLIFTEMIEGCVHHTQIMILILCEDY